MSQIICYSSNTNNTFWNPDKKIKIMSITNYMLVFIYPQTTGFLELRLNNNSII